MNIDNMTWGNHCLPFGNRTLVMGILNVTPDSFSDGGQFFSHDEALDQGNRLIDEGADILDIGGESTRPYSDPVPAEEEIRRVVPIIEHLAKHISIPISIDTTKAEVARKALDAGASIINDVSALRQDERMAEVAAAAGVPIILMHMKDAPKTMQVDPIYKDVVNDIRDFLNKAVKTAVAAGIDRDKIIIDPGIGFGKTVTHNLQLINRLNEFEELGCPIMVGPSRKFFLRQLIKHEDEKDIPANQPRVETATQAAVSAAVLNGAQFVRVHDVESTRRTVTIIDAIRNAP
jgi:dihydropteroate synthase